MLKIEGTSNTPEVIIGKDSFKMTGVCIPENAPEFFARFTEKLSEMLISDGTIKLTFQLDYFNSGSSRSLLSLFKSLGNTNQNTELIIIWMFEKGDEEMKEAGQLYEEITRLKFKFVEAIE
jgi:hypothetical protein